MALKLHLPRRQHEHRGDAALEAADEAEQLASYRAHVGHKPSFEEMADKLELMHDKLAGSARTWSRSTRQCR